MKTEKTVRERVLIVEDDRIISQVLNSLLQEEGYDVIGIVETGEDAIAEAIEGYPDIVLMDIQLQGKMDGIIATLFIDAFLHIPVIFLTSHDDEETVRKAEAVNPATFLKKPFKSVDLFTNIEIVCRNHHKILRGMDLDASELKKKAEWVKKAGSSIFLTDNRGRIVYMNPAAEQVFCLVRQLSILKPINESISLHPQKPKDDTGSDSDVSLLFHNLMNTREEIGVSLPDGSFVTMQIMVRPINGVDDQRTGLLIEFE